MGDCLGFTANLDVIKEINILPLLEIEPRFLEFYILSLSLRYTGSVFLHIFWFSEWTAIIFLMIINLELLLRLCFSDVVSPVIFYCQFRVFNQISFNGILFESSSLYCSAFQRVPRENASRTFSFNCKNDQLDTFEITSTCIPFSVTMSD
jgi:hypothetical protein